MQISIPNQAYPENKTRVQDKCLAISKILVLLAVIITCAKHDYNPQLVEYLKAEKNLRSRVNEEQGLHDSIKILQQKYDIDLEKELSQFKDNPEAWIKFLKELKIEK